MSVDKSKVMNVARGGHAINSDLAWMPSFYDKLAEVGISCFRVDWLISDLFYSVVSRSVDGHITCDFTRLDKIILPMLRKGIRPIMCMSYMPMALATDANGTSLPNSWDDYKDMLYLYVTHYMQEGYSGLVWESHNEPEGFTHLSPTDTYQMYKVFASTIKGVDSTAVVGGYGAVGRDWISYMYEFLDRYKRDSVPPLMDFFSYHQYGGDGWEDEPLIEHAFTDRGLQIPDIYIDEWNDSWQRAGEVGCSFDTHLNAVYMAKKMYLSLLLPHVKKICYFNFADTNPGHLFSGDIGAWTVDGRRKAAANVFDFYGRLYSQLITPCVSGDGVSTYDRYVFFTKENSQSLAGIAWNKSEESSICRLDFSGLVMLPKHCKYQVDKYVIDANRANLYFDYANGNLAAQPAEHEYPQIEKSWSFGTNTFVVTDTLTANSVTFYRVRQVDNG